MVLFCGIGGVFCFGFGHVVVLVGWVVGCCVFIWLRWGNWQVCWVWGLGLKVLIWVDLVSVCFGLFVLFG